MGVIKDISGQRFGRLVVERQAGQDKSGRIMWLCKCDCGNERIVHSRHLIHGATKSCGCIVIENVKTHGGSSERLYTVWVDMRSRCNSESEPSYNNYGARGIRVCSEWDDYATFRKWALSNGYDPNAPKYKCTLDRVDNDGDYCPENCRWVDRNIQGNNRRNNHYLTALGETHTLAEWSKITGINPETLRGRIASGNDPFAQKKEKRKCVNA